MLKNSSVFVFFAILSMVGGVAYANIPSTAYVKEYVDTKVATKVINNGTLTIKRNDTEVGTFTANQSADKSINIEVPTGALASKNTIKNADVASDAAISVSKISGLGALATKGTIKNDDVASDAAISVSKISGLGALATKGTIKNDDVASDAAIDQSKISGLTPALNSKVNIAQGVDNEGKGLIVNSLGNLVLSDIATSLINANYVVKEKSYVQNIQQENGKIIPVSKEFDTVINSSTVDSNNSTAPTTAAVKSYVDGKLDDLDLSTVGGDGMYIKSVQQVNGKVTAINDEFDDEIVDGSISAPQTKAVKAYVDKKTDVRSSAAGSATGSYVLSVVDDNNGILATIKSFDTEIVDGSISAPQTKAVKTYVDDQVSGVNKTVEAIKSALRQSGTGDELTYSLPVATKSAKGAVIVGDNISVDSAGKISVATGTPSTLGVVKVGQIPSGSATSTTYATIWIE